VFSAGKELDRVAIVGGSNITVVWGRSPQPPEANGGLGAELFLSILWSKYLLKTRF